MNSLLMVMTGFCACADSGGKAKQSATATNKKSEQLSLS